MKNLHHIVLKRNLLRRSMFRYRLYFWGKGFISCARYDWGMQREVREWPEGFIFLIRVLSSEPYLGLRKDQEGLHMIKANPDVNVNVTLSFKNLDAARAVFSGKITLRQAYTEKKLLLKGNSTYGLSVLRSMILFQIIFFPKLITERTLKRLIQRYLFRIRAFSEIFLTRRSAKEANLSDTKVLRVFK